MGFTKLLRKIATGSSERQSLCLVEDEQDVDVAITPDLERVMVIHNGERLVIQRNQNTKATIPELFNKTSRPCPPFCVQPMKVAAGVETIGELELLDYLEQLQDANNNVLVIDSRLKSWVDKGTIPGSVHIPWISLVAKEGATLSSVIRILRKQFSVSLNEGQTLEDVSLALKNNNLEDVFDYSQAKTLVLFCNGSWCGQTSESIKALLALGYPAEKLKYYRDGMQGWVSLGFTTVKSDSDSCEVKKPQCKKSKRAA